MLLWLQTQETVSLVTTILDMQPRMTAGGTGKSNDDIAYEMAQHILGQLVDKLDIDEAKPEMFEVSPMCFEVSCLILTKWQDLSIQSHYLCLPFILLSTWMGKYVWYLFQ